MNERIRELNMQAAEYATSVCPTHSRDWYPIQNTKFAELIVKECVKVMYDNAIERKVPPDINQTPIHYAIAVLEHFGVEE